MQRKINARIIALSIICLIVGLIIAYYNTASLGYDNANIFSLKTDAIQVFDVYIRYADIKKIIDILKNLFPKEFFTI